MLSWAENKGTIVLADGSCCIEQPAHFSVVALCYTQQGVFEMTVEGGAVRNKGDIEIKTSSFMRENNIMLFQRKKA